MKLRWTLGLLLLLCASAPARAGEGEESPGSFKPYWSETASFTFSGEPSSQGQGQLTRELSFNATNTLTESGHNLVLGVAGGEEKVEGAISNYGKLTVGGGLGLGFLSPSISLEGQKGESALNSLQGTLSCGLKFFAALDLTLDGGGGLESHQGPVSAILGTSDNINEIEDRSWSYSATVNFQAWDFLSFSLAGGQSYSQTYRYQNLSQSVVHDIDKTTRTDTLDLGLSFRFLGNVTFDVSGEIGWENDPAGSFYSPSLGKTVNFSKPTVQDITGYSLGLSYDFE